MPRLFGERIMLREYKREDLEHIRKWVNDPEVVDNLSDIFLAPHTLNNTEDFLDSVLKGARQNSYCFVIADKETEAYIGQIDLFNINWKNRHAEIGIVIGEAENRGKRIGSEALTVLQDFVFNRLNMNRLEIKVHSYNTRAHRCYLKSGFVEEGRLREMFYINGKYFDTIILSMLKSEFESRMQARSIV
ncbi:putative ribosomal N-acetyltransferase YdaF [Peptococcaceae bacterium CEB3]|nr:putative ribosomal N-acetyltransferase YdaF [Peptococcaceae bacterium CEB3]